MKTRKLMLLGLLPLMVACGGAEEEADTTNDEEVVAEEVCTYKYDENATILTWTAFKLTEKVGVDGSFDEINVVANESEDMFGVLSGATFEIPVVSVNSQDPVRDPKIRDSFFGTMDSTVAITGEIISIDENGARVSITMNGVTVEYDGEIKVKEETITMNTTIDILDFDGQGSIDEIGKVCEAKHTGEDGVNKFWSDVNVAVQTKLIKECN
ncbi:MAG: YceI family protein [Crocinitomicaceae bacterium]